MSESDAVAANRELVQEWYRVHADANADATVAMLSEDAVIQDVFGRFEGIEQIEPLVRRAFRRFGGIWIEEKRGTYATDRAIIELEFTLVDRKSPSVRATGRCIAFAGFRDGQVTRWEERYDWGYFARQLGMTV